VVLVNYRGSTGYGKAWRDALEHNPGFPEVEDVGKVRDQLVAGGVADPARLGIAGWSYGGYMTMWAVTQAARFRAAVAGAGIANWLSFHGVSILHAWDRLFYDADPYEPGGIYASRSPVLHVARATTPVLLLHGDRDRDVPPGQSWEFYRALRDHGMEAQLVLYPGAGHGPREPGHVRDVLERSLAWLTDRLH
jgi:dipeptidyl aminopeptidase/acylaminoacyl peptidase